MKQFIVSDESINSYGFRVLTAGIDTTRFLKNPVGLFNHSDEWMDDNYAGPIAKWSDLKIEGSQLLATAEFDVDDAKGKIIANKVDKGFLNAASIGFRVVETSEDPELMLPGQKYATVTKCQLIEISIVDIPSNENACCLYDDNDKRIELKDGSDLLKLKGFMPKATPPTENNFNLNMKKVTLKAGLVALAAFLGFSADDAKNDLEVEFTPEKQTELNANLAELATLKAGKTALETELATAKDTIVSLSAKIVKLEAEPTPPAPEPAAPSTEGPEAPETETLSFLSDSDAELAQLKASMGPAIPTGTK
jgi:HK97 family phage prohead protease